MEAQVEIELKKSFQKVKKAMVIVCCDCSCRHRFNCAKSKTPSYIQGVKIRTVPTLSEINEHGEKEFSCFSLTR